MYIHACGDIIDTAIMDQNVDTDTACSEAARSDKQLLEFLQHLADRPIELAHNHALLVLREFRERLAQVPMDDRLDRDIVATPRHAR